VSQGLQNTQATLKDVEAALSAKAQVCDKLCVEGSWSQILSLCLGQLAASQRVRLGAW